MYIQRYMQNVIENHIIQAERPLIILLAGVVGCGKTTLVRDFLLRSDGIFAKIYYCEQLTLDNTKLRAEIANDSEFFIKRAQDRSTKGLDKTLFFIDEVQKSEAVFDAIKLGWDQGIKFILSGSNPGYLKTGSSHT